MVKILIADEINDEAINFLEKKGFKTIVKTGLNEEQLIKEFPNDNFKGKIIYNKKYPDGVKQRKLDVRLINNLGWKSKINLKKGLKDYYKYFSNI